MKGLVMAAFLLTLGCINQAPYVWIDEYSDKNEAVQPYRLQGGDQIYVLVWNQPQLSGQMTIRSDGGVTQPLVGDVHLANLTPEGAADHIRRRLEGLVLQPKVSVSVVTSRPTLLTVMGEVRNPGRYELGGQDTLLDVLARAGGLTEFASVNAIYVMRGTEPRIRFRYHDLASGITAPFRLRAGDVVVVE